jgi:hypothetical protein
MENRRIPLWNSLRDAIGTSVREYVEMVVTPNVNAYDCTARATRCCVRVAKNDTEFLEVYLNPDDQTIRVAGEEFEKTAAWCRLNADRSDLEFYVPCDDGSSTLTLEDVARRVLEKFFFEPYPKMFHGRQSNT